MNKSRAKCREQDINQQPPEEFKPLSWVYGDKLRRIRPRTDEEEKELKEFAAAVYAVFASVGMG